MNRPNIVLLTIDTLRADRLGCYGHTANLTPNIDRLAHSGIRFDQAISGGSWTQAAFPVLLTSSYAAMYGGCIGRLAPERPSPIEALASRGYFTGGFTTNLHLSRATGIPMNTRLLKRVLPTSTQTRLTRAERAANVKRAFAFQSNEPLTNARIVLVDDVLTTGATASACAKLLRQNGADAVDVWTVARNILK